jgi:hypothetical protein
MSKTTLNRIEDDKELKQYNKQYREERKEDLKQYQKNYRQENKEIQKQRREENKEYFKQYREENKEYFKQYSKQYYQKNIENNPDKYKEKAECEYCHKLRNKFNMKRHHKSCKSKPNQPLEKVEPNKRRSPLKPDARERNPVTRQVVRE